MTSVNERKLRERNARIAFRYIKSTNTWRGRQGRGTVALVVLPNRTVFKGEAKCSKVDNFSRKKGRDLALGRAISNMENKIVSTLTKFEEKIVNKIL